jgi:hypothetical protein
MSTVKRRDNVVGIAVKSGDFPRHQADDVCFGQLSGGSRPITGGFGTSVKVKKDILEYQQGVKEG